MVDGVTMYPRMCGDQGWYAYEPAKYAHGAAEIAYWSMDAADRARLPSGGWHAFLAGKAPNYPAEALRADLADLRVRVAKIHSDATTPDTRLADDPLPYSPAVVANLVNLTTGGLYPGHVAAVLHARLRYFDPAARRPGLPDDVAALVETLSSDATTVTLLNVSPLESAHGRGARRCLWRAPNRERRDRRAGNAHRRSPIHHSPAAGVRQPVDAQDAPLCESPIVGAALGCGPVGRPGRDPAKGVKNLDRMPLAVTSRDATRYGRFRFS